MSQFRRLPELCLMMLVLVICFSWFETSSAQDNMSYVPGEVIIKFRDTAYQSEIDAILADLGATELKSFQRIKASLHRLGRMDVPEAVASYKDHPQIQYIEPNFIHRMDIIPNDPRFDELWGMHNVGQTGGTPGADISAVDAWDLYTGSDEIIVAVIDTGVDYGHADLADNMWVNEGEIPGNGIDDDANGYIDDIYGWDFYNGDSDPYDDNSHGSHCAGTIGGIGDNAVGVVGVNWNVKIMAMKFLGSGGSGSTDAAIGCVEYATMMGAHVMSNSWGGGGYSEALKEAIADANAANVLFVAAAGNSGVNNDTNPHYPSSYDLDGVLAVGATDHNDDRVVTSFWASNYGPESVDLGAPGLDILSTVPGGSYAYKGGTSMATPHVSGVAAMVYGRFPGISVDASKLLIMNSVDVLPQLEGLWVTGGRLNAFRALSGPDSIPPDPITDLNIPETGSNYMYLTWTATGDDGTTGNAYSYEMRYATFPINEGNWETATEVPDMPDPLPVGSGEVFRLNGLDFSTGYHVGLKAFDEYGNDSGLSNIVFGMTLGPPDIDVTPGSFVASLITGEVQMETMTIANTEGGTLEFSIATEETGAPAAARVTTSRKLIPSQKAAVRSTPSQTGPDYDAGRAPARAPIGPNEIKIAGDPRSNMRLLLLTSGSVIEITPLLMAFPDVAVVDMFDIAGAVPALVDLETYDVVVVVSNSPLADPFTTGNVLADYVDQGGSVVMTVASFIPGWNIEGRFLDEGYYPFLLGTGPIGSANLGTFDPGHPIMAGVTAAWGDLRGSTSPAAGAEWVADWDDGSTLVATLGQVAGVNAFVADGGYWTGDIPLIIHNAALFVSGYTEWLTVDTETGEVLPFSSVDVMVTFDAAGLCTGDWSADILVSSNDPDEPLVTVGASMHVTGQPDIDVSDETIDYEQVFIGVTKTDTLVVTNAGCDILNITALNIDHPDFGVDTTAFSLAEGESRLLEVTFSPSTTGPIAGVLTIASEDPDEPALLVTLQGEGLVAPTFSVAPESLYADLLTGEMDVQTLTVSNTGGSDLLFDVFVEGDSCGAFVLDVVGGPEVADAELLGVGRPVPLADLEEMRNAMPRKIEVQAEGVIDRGTPFVVRDGVARPANAERGEDIFGNMDNMFCSSPRTRGNLFTCTSTNNLLEHRLYLDVILPTELWFVVYEGDAQVGIYNLISASDVSTAGPGEGWYSSGDLGVTMEEGKYYLIAASFASETCYFNQMEISPYPIEASFGELTAGAGWAWAPTSNFPPDPTQDVPDFTFGEPVAYYQTIVTGVGTSWLGIDPVAGVVPMGGSVDLTVTFDASGVCGGDYCANILINHNDPFTPPGVVPAHMHVTGEPDIELSTDSFDFGQVFLGGSASEILTISNPGCDLLSIPNIFSNNADFDAVPSSFDLLVGESMDVTVIYTPSGLGPDVGTLTIISNDPDEPSLAVAMSGEGIPAPDITVEPDSLFADLLTGETDMQILTISNEGGSDLVYSIGAEEGECLLARGANLSTGRYLNGRPAAAGGALDDKAAANAYSTGQEPSRGMYGAGDIVIANERASDLSILLLASGAVSEIQTLLLAFPDISLVDVFNADTDTPDLADLLPYQVVITLSNTLYADPFETGNVLADYVDQGGAVILTVATFVDGFHIQGRFLTDGYSPFELGFGPLGAANLAAFDPAHPIMEGVTDAWGDLLATAPLAPGAEWVADWSNGETFIATQGEQVVGINAFLIDFGYWTGDLPLILHNAAFWAAKGASWLSVDPAEGILPPGQSQLVMVTFDATELCGGDYCADLLITNNDPETPEILVPAHLRVTGEPDIELSDTSYDFGQVFIGGTGTAILTISNPGCDLLSVTDIDIPLMEFTADASAFDLGVGESRDVTISYDPVNTGIDTTLMVIESNDPDEPARLVFLAGEGIVAPDIDVTPASLTSVLNQGDSEVQILTIANTGGSDLTFSVDIAGAGAKIMTSSLSSAPSFGPFKVPGKLAGNPAIKVAGKQSGKTGLIGRSVLQGATPNQTDPTLMPGALAGEYGGDHFYFGITDLGELMPFQYPIGNEHLAVGGWFSGYTVAYFEGGIDHVYYAGYSSTNGITPVSYQELVNDPDRLVVEVVTETIDAQLQIVRLITFERDEKRVNIQTTLRNVSGSELTDVVFKSHCDWDADADFEDDNWNYDFARNMVYAWDNHYVSIVGQRAPDFMDLDGWNDYQQRATIVDFPTGPINLFDGYEILHFEMGDLAIGAETDIATAFIAADDLPELLDLADQAFVNWLEVDITSGVVPAGGTLDLQVTFDASDLESGEYAADITIESNDPDEAVVVVPASLTVMGVMFTVEIDVSAGVAIDPDYILGAADTATDGYDPDWDLPETAPPPPAEVDGWFPHPGWPAGDRYRTDYRAVYDPTTDMKMWEFTVDSEQSGSVMPVRLDFTPSFSPSSGWALYLEDLTTGMTHNLFPMLSYEYMPIASDRTFLIKVGSVVPPLEPTSRLVSEGWSMLGLPLVAPPGANSLGDVILDDVTGPVFLFTHGGPAGYAQRSASYIPSQGEGLWIAATDSFVWSMEGEMDEDGVDVPLYDGWNVVGYPLWMPGNLDGVMVEHGSVVYTYAQAASAGLVAANCYDYNSSTGSYFTTSALEAWHGYWFAAYVPGVHLWFDYTNMAAGGGRGSEPFAESGSDIWRVVVNLAGGGDTIKFGMHPGASDGFDAEFDMPVPPISPDGVRSPSLRIPHPEWGLSTGRDFYSDIVAPSEDPRQWMAVLSSPEPGAVVLQWEVNNWPAEADFQIYLPGHNRVVVSSMREQQSVTLNVGAEPLTIQFRTPDFLTDVPGHLAGLELRNQPNPFNPSTEFMFNLPRQGQIEIRIFNVRGLLVRRLDGGVMTAGPAKLCWRGRNDEGAEVASGAYFYRLYLDGRQEGPSKKMIMVK